jgi:hypothetical protein
MADEQAKLLDAYVQAVAEYNAAVQTMAALAGTRSGAFDRAMMAVNATRAKTERARVMLQVYRDQLKMEADVALRPSS